MAFIIPNLAAAAHSDQAAPDKVDFDALVAGYGGNGVVSGCGVTANAGLTVSIAAGVIMVGGAVVSVGGTTKTSAAAHATLNRFDLVVVDNAGVVSIQGGTAAAVPAFPAIPANSIALASLFIGAAQVTTSANEIIDKRVILLNTFAGGLSTMGNTSGNTGAVTNRLLLAGGNNITLSGSTQSGSMTITISAGSGLTAGMSNAGNTSGSTGLVNAQLVFVGGNNITLSQSTNGVSSGTITISALPANTATSKVLDVTTAAQAGTLSASYAAADHQHRGLRAWNVNGIASTFFGDVQFSAGNAMSLATAGNSTAGSVQFINAGIATISNWRAGGLAGPLVATQQNQALQFFYPDHHEGYASASVADLWLTCAVSTSSNSSWSANLSVYLGYYTLNGATLSRASSGSASYGITVTSSNGSDVLTGAKRMTIPINLNITPGHYWVGYGSSTASTNANWITMSNFAWQDEAGIVVPRGDFLSASVASTHQYMVGVGLRNALTASAQASVALTDLSNQQFSHVAIYLRNFTKY